ncbi:MAG TPA: M23 family metallopeptidase, partial [Ornithinibacter sp.]|nr:M23 family metallopeptidase [Ornithinibacter sp.]
GRVTHAGVVAGRGTVSVEHRDGLVSTYEPVSPGVTVGDDVSAGQALGLVTPGAAPHCGATGCLHLGARRQGAYLDPWPLLLGGEIALLPVG